MKTIAIIPARMASTRFPGKPMVKIMGMPMIGHVYLRTKMCKSLNDVYVATCDREIFEYIISIGGKAVMTSDKHERASDRAAEAVQTIEKEVKKDFDVVAMIQGDEPLLIPEMIKKGIKPLEGDPTLKVSNLVSKLKTIQDFENPNEVKVVLDNEGNALYLSREPIPSRKKYNAKIPMIKQLGMIFFRKEFLIQYSKMPQTTLEIIESIDVLRILENNIRIKTVMTDFESIGVDTKEDLDCAEKIMKNDPVLPKYLK